MCYAQTVERATGREVICKSISISIIPQITFITSAYNNFIKITPAILLRGYFKDITKNSWCVLFGWVAEWRLDQELYGPIIPQNPHDS